MFRIKINGGTLEIKKEIVVTLIFDVFAFAYWFSSKDLSAAAMMFPNCLLIGIVVFSIMAIAQDVHFTKKPSGTSENEIGYGITKKLVCFLFLTFLMLLAYKSVGFIICIFVYLMLSMWILGMRNKLVLVLVPLIIDVFVFFVFKMWLEVPLPMGLLKF